jgi:hypothetical protein
MIRRFINLASIFCATSLGAFYDETIYGPEKAFELTADETRWEKIEENTQEEGSSYIFQHREEPLSASLIFQVLPRECLAQLTDDQLVETFIQMIHMQFDQAFFQTNRVEERQIGDKAAVFIEEEIQIADEESVQTCYVDALVYKGENYFLCHYVMSGDENARLMLMEDVEDFLLGLKINSSEV